MQRYLRAGSPSQHSASLNMAGSQDKSHGSKKQAPKTAKSGKRKERCRVVIGDANERWQALKAKKKFHSDREVALRLLDVMESQTSKSATSDETNEKKIFSRSELQTLIEWEVHSAVKKQENKLQGLMESIQELDRRVDFEQLEARINTIAERALAFTTKKTEPLPSLSNADSIRSDSVDEAMEEDVSENERRRTVKIERLLETMDTTKKVLLKVEADNEDFKAPVKHLCEEAPPPVLPAHGSPDCKGLKKEPKDEKPIMMAIKESLSPFKHSEEDKSLYPPLPSNVFPSTLDMKMASYNIPQKPEVRLALVRNPASLSVIWSVAEEDPFAPPMKSYSIFMSTEKPKGSGVFVKWTSLGELAAKPLPMCVAISKYKPGLKVLVAIVGKDKFDRYGPYSEIVTATIPD